MKKVLLLFLVCAASMLAISPALAAKDELVIAVGDYIMSGKFNPADGWGMWAPDIFHCHMLKIGDGNKPEFDLATSEKISSDGLTYTYGIRRDAKFTDGQPITAHDVAFSYETVKAAASAFDLTMMESARAIDDYTVEFKLNKPWSSFPYALISIGIMPKHAYDEKYGSKPLGSGAWKIVDIQPSQQIILEPSEHYYGARSPFKRVVILKLDQDATLAAAQSGKIDLVWTTAEFKDTKIPGMSARVFETCDLFSINMATVAEGKDADGRPFGSAIMSDIAIRRALNIGISRETIIAKALNGMGHAITSKGNILFGSDVAKDGRIEEAKKILDDAGWKLGSDGVRSKDGVRAEFTITGRSNDLDRYYMALALADEAKALGISITAKSEAWAEARYARAIPTFWVDVMTDPIKIYNYYHTSMIGRGVIGNPASFSNAEADMYIEAALAATDADGAMKNWKRALDIVDEYVPYLDIARSDLIYLAKDELVIPKYNKLITRGQGLSAIENMNEWSWKD